MVGTLLAQVRADEKIIAAGILHDTIEDCKPYGSITKELLAQEFTSDVACMVNDVTKQDKSLPWAERKQAALDHIAQMAHGSQLMKSADVLYNMRDMHADVQTYGDESYEQSNAPKEDQLARCAKLIAALERAWAQNHFLPDLKNTLSQLDK